MQPVLNAFIRLDHERAAVAALAADARKDFLPLRGRPVGYKDMFDRRGHCASFGSRVPQPKPAAQTATALRRLEDGGAILVGALNMSEFALGPTGHNAAFGHCRNPRDADYVSGGSSSGAGAAVAAGILFGAIGSDTGGSIRIPAACCGVVGLKPTQGTVSRHGTLLLSFSLDCIGPIARTASGCARLFAAIAGEDSLDPTSLRGGHVDAHDVLRPMDTTGLRLAFPAADVDAGAAPEISRAIQRAVSKLVEAGVHLAERPLPQRQELHVLADVVQKAESAAAHAPRLRQFREAYSGHVRRRIEAGFLVSAAAYVQALSQRASRLEHFLGATLGDAAALIIPTVGVHTPRIDETDEERLGAMPDIVPQMTGWTRWVNYLGLPALSIPLALDSRGLPIGVQLVGRPSSEWLLLRIGRLIEIIAAEAPFGVGEANCDE